MVPFFFILVGLAMYVFCNYTTTITVSNYHPLFIHNGQKNKIVVCYQLYKDLYPIYGVFTAFLISYDGKIINWSKLLKSELRVSKSFFFYVNI